MNPQDPFEPVRKFWQESERFERQLDRMLLIGMLIGSLGSVAIAWIISHL